VKHLHRLGPVLVDPVQVCVMFKRTRTFAEVRSKKSALVLSMLLSEEIEHPKVARRLRTSANRVAHFVELERVADVDGVVRGWLRRSFLESPP
jgi:hypothetical protein